VVLLAEGNAVALTPALAMGRAIWPPAACRGVDTAGQQGQRVCVLLLQVGGLMVVEVWGGSLVGMGGGSWLALLASSMLSSGQGFGPFHSNLLLFGYLDQRCGMGEG